MYRRMSKTPRLDALLAACANPRIRAIREEGILRRARAAGLGVEEYIAESEAAADAVLSYNRFRYDRGAQRHSLARHAAVRGNTLTWGLS